MAEDFDEEKIRYLGDVQRLELRPGDVIVLKAKIRLSDEVHDRLKAYLENALPGYAVIVLDDRLDLGVLAKAE